MSVEGQLISGEQVLASCGKFHLTERRLLKYEGGQVLFLPIGHITTISSATTYIKPAIIAGGILLGVGIMAMLLGVMADAMSASLGATLSQLGQEVPATNYSAMVSPIFVALTVAGIAAMGAGIAFRRNWYQIKAAGLTKEDTKTWRIPRENTIEAKNFIRMLETRIAGGGPEKIQTAPTAPGS